MGFNCGIVGLPNVGKSTLFNALTSTAAAEAANFPFCTIEPNVGIVTIPDPRLKQITKIAKSKKQISTSLEFVDIAGLVRGASKGEGLGNQFLANIREVDAIVHVLRCFNDENITHVNGRVDPIADAETVETELMLADLESLEKRIQPIRKKAQSGDKDSKTQVTLMERVINVLENGKPARITDIARNELKAFKMLQLLTSKPILYCCNVEEEHAADGNALSRRVQEKASTDGAACVVVSAAIESEIAQMNDSEEKSAFLTDLGLEESGLSRVIRAGYNLLDLITFFTAGEKESRAWTVYRGTTAPAAAGAIHTDFEKGFIRAETTAFNDYVAYSGESGAKDAGKLRLEGKDYVVQDGDIMHFRFNV